MNDRIQSIWYKRLFTEVDNGPLILFRIVFGFLLFCHCVAFIGKGVNEYFVQPTFVFTSIGFEFLQNLRGEMMYYYFAVMAICSLLIMVGLFYRFSIVAFTILWQIVYLVQVANYNNHFYLILLLCYLMIFMPANRYLSLDIVRKPGLEKLTCPRWIYLLFIAQVIIIYFYAGIHKINASWLSGAVYRTNHAFKTSFPIVGSLFFVPLYKYLIVYGGLLFELLLCPLLLTKRFRKIAFALACLFHLFNSYLFDIGIFPYLSITLLVFFFDPKDISSIFFPGKKPVLFGEEIKHPGDGSKHVIYLLVLYLFIQMILPLRAHLFEGNTYWTEEGYRMSWRMMLRNKSGVIHFTVKDSASKRTWTNVEQKLTRPQQKVLAINPDVIWQYAQYLKKDFAKQGFNTVQVFASSWVKINEQPARQFIDSTVDLSKAQLHAFKHEEWILPFQKK